MLESWKIPSCQPPLWFLCGSTLQHMAFWTTAEWERVVAMCLSFKNWGLGLHFPVLVQVSKMGLTRESKQPRKGCWQEQKCAKNSCALPSWLHAHNFEIRDYLKSRFMAWAQGTCIITLYIEGFAVLFGVASVLISHPGSRRIRSAWASSPPWGSLNLHPLCRIIGFSR